MKVRNTGGMALLTPRERDVVRLAAEGTRNQLQQPNGCGAHMQTVYSSGSSVLSWSHLSASRLRWRNGYYGYQGWRGPGGDQVESRKQKALRTGKVMTPAAFMIVSNIYTTVAYFLHERMWAGIKWGIKPQEEH